MPAFQADEPSELAGLEDALHVVGSQGLLEDVGIALRDPVDDVDLLEGAADRFLRILESALARDWRVRRKEHAADAAALEALDVGLDAWLRLGDVELLQIPPGLLAHLKRIVVVAVDERHLPVQRPRALEERVGRLRRLRGSRADRPP